MSSLPKGVIPNQCWECETDALKLLKQTNKQMESFVPFSFFFFLSQCHLNIEINDRTYLSKKSPRFFSTSPESVLLLFLA